MSTNTVSARIEVYGNGQSDHFGLFAWATGLLFFGVGFLASVTSGLVLFVGVLAFVALSAVMVRFAKAWSVKSMVAAPIDNVVHLAPAPIDEASLPQGVAKPKSAVETNTTVAA